jgi:hypothetical protein
MLLAVAGLDGDALNEHTRQLAGGDWSCFSPAQRAAFVFAHKLARGTAAPAQDFQDLVRQCGRDRALDVLWWACHCQYMTRVADALQLPLEGANVFDGFSAAAGGPRRP